MNIECMALSISRPLTGEERELFAAGLPYHRYQRLLHMKEEKRPQVLLAYGLLQMALLVRYEIQGLPEIRVEPEGRPVFQHMPELWFSLSHTDTAVAVALGAAPLGIDIETRREAAPLLLRHYGIDSEAVFWETWVRREALIKYHGHGAASLVRWDEKWEADTFVQNLDLLPDCAAAVATGAGEHAIRTEVVTIDDVINALKPLYL